MSSQSISRRNFVSTAATSIAASPFLGALASPVYGDILGRGHHPGHGSPAIGDDHSLRGRVWKTLKLYMTGGVKGSLTDKFKAAKEAGFQGMEMDSPGMDVEETKRAIQDSGLPVDGTVCSTHWNLRHTDPDEKVRASALADLQKAIRDTDAVGGKTVLLVAGHGKDGTKEEIWQRALDNIRLAIPLAAERGISIVIENVWNHFMYDHNGGQDQTADEFVRFVDELNSPWVGMQFDIGNHWKYGNVGDWIRQLGKRIYKLDIKGYSRAESRWTDIGEDDIDWADVRKALLEINYHGWVAAEVGEGDLERLKKVSAQIDSVFKLSLDP
jgi:hexulose-6-phosphate isomerase